MTHALIVDDQPGDADVLAVLLEQSGLTVTYLKRGEDVPETVEEIPDPDVIFLDLEMPGVTGYDLIAWFLEHPDLHDVPVVAYTCHTNLMATAYDIGFHSFIGKPLRAGAFREKLEHILNDEPVWD